MSEKPKKKKVYRRGSRIMIKVGGREYLTVIDPSGVQRFVENHVVSFLLDCAGVGMDMNKLRLLYNEKKFELREYAEFHMAIGYSVCGFAELSPFFGLKIENPVWD